MVKYFAAILLLPLLSWASNQQDDLKRATDLLMNMPDSSIYYSSRVINRGNLEERVKANYLIGRALINKGQNKEARSSLQKALALAEKTNDLEIKFETRSHLGDVSYRMSNYDSAIYYHQSAISMIRPGFDSLKVGNAYQLLANVYLTKGQLEEATRGYIDALKYFENSGAEVAASKVYNNLGIVSIYLNDFAEALDYFNRSLEIKLKLGDRKGAAATYNNMGTIAHSYLKDANAALEYFEKSITIKKEIGDVVGAATTEVNWGHLLLKDGNESAARARYDEAIKIFKEANMPSSIASAYTEIGINYKESGDIGQAIYFLKNAQKIPENQWDSRELMKCSKAMAEAYQELGDYKSSIEQFWKFQVLYDSIFQEEKIRFREELVEKYESEKKESEIELLTREKQLQAAVINQSRKMQYAFLMAAVLAIILGILYYSRFRIKKKLVEEKEVLLKEIHHRVKNNLQIIESLLSLQEANSGEREAEELLKISQDRIHAISAIHEKLYQSENLREINFKSYVEDMVSHFADTYSAIQVSFKSNVDSVDLDLDQLIPCGLIINELITNSLKYAFVKSKDPSIEINGRKEQDSYHLEIADNGVGFSDSEVFTSLGLRLVQSLVKQLGGTIQKIGDIGTRYKISFAV